jgi:predicted MPP superfamily phosphohydrolase
MTEKPALNNNEQSHLTSPPAYQISRRGLFRAAHRCSIGFVGLSLVGGAWGYAAEPHMAEVTRFDVALPHLPAAFDGFQIVHISDIHIDYGQTSQIINKFCHSIAELNADAVLITGDFFTVTPTAASTQHLIEALKPLRAKEGIWGIVGNHDVDSDNDEQRGKNARKAIRDAGVRLLDNEVHIFRRGDAELYLAGVDDLLLGSPDVKGVSAQIPPKSAAIFMGHEPDFAPEIARLGKFGLMLSGHSHGGQVCMPLIGPLVLPFGGKKYPRGWYDFGDPTDEKSSIMRLYTNRGLGTVGPRVRLLCRPEITVLTLKSSH